MNKNKKNRILPLIAMKGLVVFPEMVLNLMLQTRNLLTRSRLQALLIKLFFLLLRKILRKNIMKEMFSMSALSRK